MKITTSIAVALFAIAGLLGCDGAIDSVYEEELVLSAYLFAGESIDSIILERTTPFGQKIDDEAIAVTGANITLTSEGKTYMLQALPGKPGRYYLPAQEHIVEGGKRYDIRVEAGSHTLSAWTEVPMPIRWKSTKDSLPVNRIVTLDTNRFGDFIYKLAAGPRDYDHRKYVLKVTSLDRTPRLKISKRAPGPPVDTSAYTRYSFVRTAPEIALGPELIAYYGRNHVSLIALDTNWYDYRRMVFGSRGNYAPSLNRVQGGLGVFGSGARDTLTIFVKAPTS